MKLKILHLFFLGILFSTTKIHAQGGTFPLDSTIIGNIAVNGQVNYWSVTTTQNGDLSFFLGNFYEKPDLYVSFYAADTTRQIGPTIEVSGRKNETNGGWTSGGLAPGTYIIKVNALYGTGTYVLSNSFYMASGANDDEPDDYAKQALTLPLNDSIIGQMGYSNYTTYKDSTDWYKVITNANGKLRLTLDNNSGANSSADFYAVLYASDTTTQLGSMIESWYGNGYSGQLNIDSLPPGTYYIKLYPGFAAGTYSIADSFFVYTDTFPVTFLNFDGKLDNDKAILSWKTAGELNNKGFDVQKSYNGIDFTDIGFAEGHNYSSVINSYNYTDVKVLSGTNYYRLKQISNDGKFSYSAAVRLDFKNLAWKIFGSPVHDDSWVQVQLSKTSSVVLQIINSYGKFIKTINKGTLSQGTYSFTLPMAANPSGIYLVRLVIDNQSYSKMIVK